MSELNSILEIPNESGNLGQKKSCVSCQETIPAVTTFCPFCGASQSVVAANVEQGYITKSYAVSENPNSSYSSVIKNATLPVNGKNSASIEFRAGDSIWEYGDEEPIEYLYPNVKRPLVIVDEESVYLSVTDKKLMPEELLDRVKRVIEFQKVPVIVYLANARWIKDKKEVRNRIIAELGNHSYSDVKMIMGLDYMGDWANFSMQVGMQPESIPPMPKTDQTGMTLMIIGGISIVLGILLLIFIIGILFIIIGIPMCYFGYHMHEKNKLDNRSSWIEQQNKKAREKFSRTYKVDDMRLFSTAMKVVFKAVVDDIVERGGKVVREDGGRGGYFEAQPVARKTDAAQSGV